MRSVLPIYVAVTVEKGEGTGAGSRQVSVFGDRKLLLEFQAKRDRGYFEIFAHVPRGQRFEARDGPRVAHGSLDLPRRFRELFAPLQSLVHLGRTGKVRSREAARA